MSNNYYEIISALQEFAITNSIAISSQPNNFKGIVNAINAMSEGVQTTLTTKADLVEGKLSVSQLPDISVVEFKGPVADESAMLAITGEKGDWVVRNDDGKVYIITGTDPTSISSWTAWSYPDVNYADLLGKPTLGTAAATAATDYATSAQGAKADAAETKLAGIESGATADQTGAEIKAAYEGEGDTNAFTDADHTKLDGIETAATADQTGAEIKAAYEGESDTNAFTDADHSKLDGIEAGSQVNTVNSVASKTGAVTLVKADVGLGNVDNTADSAKPVSTAAQTALNAKADLVGGKLNTSQIPDLAVTEYLGAVANETAMLALTGEKGDWCNRSDTGQMFIISGTDPTQLSNWASISYPASPVVSVAGKTGSVTLTHDDIGSGAITASTGSFSGNVAVSGTVDGRDISTDGTKLDSIETGAQVNAANTVVDANYVATDENFTTADHAKLDGIATGAQVNSVTSVNGSTGAVTVQGFSGNYNDLTNKPTIPAAVTNNNQLTNGAGYITSADGGNADTLDGQDGTYYLNYNNLTNVPAGSANADTVDNLHAASFLRSDAADAATGQIKINDGNANPLELERTSQVGIEFNDTSVGSRYLGVNSGNLRYGSDLNHGNNNLVWHAGNDGSGSGLDADTCDGQQLGTGASPTFNNVYADGWLRNNNSGQGLYNEANDAHFYSAGGNYWHINGDSGNHTAGGLVFYTAYNPTQANSSNRKGYVYFDTSGFGLLSADGSWAYRHDNTNADIYGTIRQNGSNTVWHAGNDGSGSGLDADTLDGKDSSFFFKSYSSSTGGWEDSNQNFLARSGGGSMGLCMESSTGGFGFQLYASGSHYGFLSSNWGGWDIKKTNNGNMILRVSGTERTVWHTGNDGSGSGLDADLLDGANGSSFLRSDTDDSFSGGLTSTSRDEGIFGSYDSYKTDHIWGMGTSYKNHSSGTNFGNLYGLAYKHTNNTTGGTMGGGHQVVWCTNGSGRGAIGHSQVWHAEAMRVTTSNHIVWHAGNDGSGSGLDADNLDGKTWDSSGKNVRATEFYADNWFRNYNSGEGMYNQATGAHWYSDGDGVWNLTGNTQNQSTNLKFRGTNNGNIEGWLHADGSGWFGTLNTGGQWQLRSYNPDGQSPNLYFMEDANTSWTGNPGSNQGKIEYHSDRFYIASGSNSTYVCQFRRSGTDVCRIENSGAIVSSSNITAYSDINLKENIEVIPNALDKVSALRGITYNRKDVEGKPRHSGVIAQEVEAVLPEVVMTGEDGIKSVAYGNLVGLLIEAVKELKAEIETLKQEHNS